MKALTKTVSSLLAVSFLAGALGYLIRVLLARNLSVADFGLFFAVYSFLFFFTSFRSMGLTEAIIFFASKYGPGNGRNVKAVLRAAIWPQLLASIVFVVVVLLGRGFLGTYYFHDSRAASVLVVLVAIFLLDVFSGSLTSLFIAMDRVILAKIADFFRSLALVVAILYGFHVATGYLVPAYAYLFASCAALIFSYVSYRFVLPDVSAARAGVVPGLIKKLLDYGLPILLASGASLLFTYFDVLLLTYMQGVTAVAMYNAAYPIAYAILLAFSPLTIILFPRVAKLYHARDSRRITELISIIYNNLLVVLLPVALLCLAYGELIVTLIFGDAYYAAATTFKIFSVVAVLMVIWDVNVAIMNGLGMTAKRSKMIVWGAIIVVGSGVLFIPKFGIVGAAAGVGTGFLFLSVASVATLCRLYPIRIHVWEQIRVVIAGLLFLGMTEFLKHALVIEPWWLEMPFVLLGAGLTYVVALILLRVLTVQKWNRAKKLLF